MLFDEGSQYPFVEFPVEVGQLIIFHHDHTVGLPGHRPFKGLGFPPQQYRTQGVSMGLAQITPLLEHLKGDLPYFPLPMFHNHKYIAHFKHSPPFLS